MLRCLTHGQYGTMRVEGLLALFRSPYLPLSAVLLAAVTAHGRGSEYFGQSRRSRRRSRELSFALTGTPVAVPIWRQYSAPHVYWMAKDGSIGWGLGTDSVWKYEGKAWRNDLEGSLAAVGVDPQVLWASDDGQAAWAIGKRGVLRLRQGRWQQDTRSTSNLPDDFGPVDEVDPQRRDERLLHWKRWCSSASPTASGPRTRLLPQRARKCRWPRSGRRADGGEAWILGKNGFAVHMLEGK